MICFWISLKQNTLRKDPSSLKKHIQLQNSQLCLHARGVLWGHLNKRDATDMSVSTGKDGPIDERIHRRREV